MGCSAKPHGQGSVGTLVIATVRRNITVSGVITSMGYDPMWFGVIIVLVTQIGVITPPVGVNVYVVSGVARTVPLEVIFKGVIPLLMALVVGVLLMIPFPQIALFLPGLMK